MISIYTYRKITLILSILVFSCLQGFSQSKPLPKQLKGFDKFVEKELKKWNAPGVSVAIVYDGEVILTKGYGYADVENKRKADENTLFAIGSSSKAFTAATVMQLVDDEKIELDKPVRTYLPDFKLYTDELSKNLTVRDLLTHRSGLPRHDLVWYGSPFDRKELYERLQYLEPTEPLRQAWQYQNLMYMTAGYLVGELENTTWENYVVSEIFNPLKMSASNCSTNDMQKNPNHALPYKENEEEAIEKMDFRNIDNVGPAGSINSNAVDMAKWIKMLLNKGAADDEILTEASVQEMVKPQMIMPSNMSDEGDIFYTSYGLGWFITSYRGHLRVEHGGNIDGFTANVCIMPRDDFGVVVLTNQNGSQLPSIIRNNVIDRLLELEIKDWSKKIMEGIEKSKEAADEDKEEEEDVIQKNDTKPSYALDKYVGQYEHQGYGIITVSQKEKDLLHFKLNGIELDMEHYHFDVFKAKGSPLGDIKVQFVLDINGDIVSVQSKLEPTLDEFMVFKKMPKPVELNAADLEKYVGDFELMGQTIKFEVKDEKLMATVPGQPTYTLVPSGEHKFDLKGLKGYSVLFSVEADKADKATFMQPNGNFTAKRK